MEAPHRLFEGYAKAWYGMLFRGKLHHSSIKDGLRVNNLAGSPQNLETCGYFSKYSPDHPEEAPRGSASYNSYTLPKTGPRNAL